MVDIAAQSVTWSLSSGRYVASPQYIQTAINAQSAGTTYVIEAGVHRGQTFVPKAGDTFDVEAGVTFTGGEVISTSGWTNAGGSRWYKAIDINAEGSSTGVRVNYQRYLENIVLDGTMVPYQSGTTYVDEDTAYYDGTNIHIGIDPSTLTTIEVARPARFVYGSVDDVTISGDASERFVIENYAPTTQAQGAAVGLGRDPDDPSGDDWLMENVIMRNMGGSCFAFGASGSILRNFEIYEIGQIGMSSGSGSDDWVGEYGEVSQCGWGQWKGGWESGNTKFARSLRGIIRGCHFFYDDRAHFPEPPGVLWYDINNDGCEVYDCIIADYSTDGIDARGIFWEISYSIKVHHNIIYRCARDSGGAGFAKAFSSSSSGAESGKTIFDKIYVSQNTAYKCAGGFGGFDQQRCGVSLTPSIALTGVPTNCWGMRDGDFRHNVTYFDDSFTDYTEETGVTDDRTDYTPTTQVYDYNLYFVPSLSGNHFNDDQSGGEGANIPWATWDNSQDANGLAFADNSHHSTDPNPFNGGCM